jgi:heat shock protein HspQ
MNVDMIDDDQEGFLDEVEVDYDNIPDDVLEEMDKSYYRLMVESGDISDDV